MGSMISHVVAAFAIMAAVALLVVGVLAWFLKHPIHDADAPAEDD